MDNADLAKLQKEAFFESSLHFDDPEQLTHRALNVQSKNTNSLEFQDPNFYESIVICNEIDVEDELKKVKDDDESVFKMLSMSFYDKAQINRPFKTHNPSPACFDDHNRSIISNNGTPFRTTKIKTKLVNSSSNPSQSHQQGIVNLSLTKKSPELYRPTPTPPPKLFSIQEKTDGMTLLSQISTQKINLGSMANNHSNYNSKKLGNGNPTNSKNLKDTPSKQNLSLLKQQKSPRKENLTKASSGEKLKNVDLSLIKRSHSPDLSSIKPLYTQQSDDPTFLFLTLSPRGYDVKAKSKPETSKSKPTSQTKIVNKKLSLESARKEVIRPETSWSPSSPTDFTAHRTAVIKNIEAKRAKMNTPVPSKVATKEKSSLDLKTKNLNDSMNQIAKPMKVDLTTRSYKKSQSSTKSSSGSAQKEAFIKQKSQQIFKRDIPPKVTLDHQNVKDELNSSKANSTKGKSKPIDLSTQGHNGSNLELQAKETIDHIKFYLKSQLKVPLQKKVKEFGSVANKDTSVSNASSLRLKTFEVAS